VVAYDSVWKHHLEVCKESLLVKINRGASSSPGREDPHPGGGSSRTPSRLEPKSPFAEKIQGKGDPAQGKAKVSSPFSHPEEKEFIKQLPDNDLRRLGAKILRRIPLEPE